MRTTILSSGNYHNPIVSQILKIPLDVSHITSFNLNFNNNQFHIYAQ